MEETKKDKLIELLIRLKRVHKVYCKASEDTKGKLLEAIEPTIEELIDNGYTREFLETLIIGGKDFLESLEKVEGLDLWQSTQLIFKSE